MKLWFGKYKKNLKKHTTVIKFVNYDEEIEVSRWYMR